MSKTISIVVPIYNAAKHISHLIDSVLAQTHQQWQLILVNDGSRDNSLEICQKYAINDNRIIVVDQPNAGPSAARNLGILHATGDWITFVDADDDLLDCFLESMMHEAAKCTSVDIVFAGYIIAEPQRKNIYTYNTIVYNGIANVKEAITKSNILHRCCPWGKMFRRSVLTENDILFDTQLAHSEDRLFVYDYLLHTRGIATTSTIGYLYDSTQVGTLKNKVLAVDKLYIRQQRLTEAAHRVISHFRLTGVDLYPIAKHLILLYATAIQGFYYAMGNTSETVKKQKGFYNECFDKELYNVVRDLDEWKKLTSRNEMLQLALDCQFRKINSKLAIIDRKITLSNILNKYKGYPSNSDTFSKVVTVLNKMIHIL